MTSKNATIHISLRNDKIVDQTYNFTIYKQTFYQISLKGLYSLISAKLNTEKHKTIDKLIYMEMIILAYSVYVVLVIPTVRVICLHLAKSRANLGAVYRKKSKQQHQLAATIFF